MDGLFGLPPEAYECPICSQPSGMILSAEQAFCTNDSCRCFTFAPNKSDGGLSQAQVIRLRGPDGESP